MRPPKKPPPIGELKIKVEKNMMKKKKASPVQKSDGYLPLLVKDKPGDISLWLTNTKILMELSWYIQCSQQASPAAVLESLGQSGRNLKSLQMPRPSP